MVHQLLPYVLRKAALYERLEPFELGRVFYHLSKRVGFLSNRKETKSKDAKKNESSEVKEIHFGAWRKNMRTRERKRWENTLRALSA